MKQTSQKARHKRRKATHAARKLPGQIRFEKESFSRIKGHRYKRYSEWFYDFLTTYNREPKHREFAAAASSLGGFGLIPGRHH